MKKKINTDAIKSELQGSVFFPAPSQEPAKQQETTPAEQGKKTDDTMTPRYHDTMTPRNHDTAIPFSEDEILKAVRKAVKQVGKEAATQRLTIEEKQALADIEYSYKRLGIKTSGNEIMRIATNYIVKDYQQNGENSIVAKVIQRLNS